MPKRVCPSRAEWRLQPGKPAEPLSPHYRLDCDYGTGVITCWEEGGSEPIYVCESHAKQLGRPRKQPVTDIRVVTREPGAGNDALVEIKVEDRTPSQEAVATTSEPAAAVAAKVTAPPPDVAAPPVPEADRSDEPPKIEDQTPAQEAASSEPAAAVASEVTAPPPDVAASPASEPDRSEKPAKVEGRAEMPEAAPPAPPTSAAPAEAPRRPPETRAGRAAESPVRSPARDLAYGNPAKAIVDEAIWNMPAGNFQAYTAALQQGKSTAEAAEAAGGQLAMIHRKIGDYTLRLENFLAASRAKISVIETVDKPLENAVSEVIGNGAMSDSEKDTAIQQLGTIQQWVKYGAQTEITPLQANRMLLAIGDRLNWGGIADVPEEFKPVYRTLYGNLKNAIRSAVPETQNLHDRLTNLYAAKSDLEAPLATIESR